MYTISFPSDFEVTVVRGGIKRPLKRYADFVIFEGKWKVYVLSERILRMMSTITDCVVVVEKPRRRSTYTCKEFAEIVVELNE
jgi:hypothetical protein